ncbi:MAG: hypothetical protein H7Y02_10670 [Candidatus Obscuribacterales bacterium]|nr:hypothetical protein [Steroidobacteraceae bacterium]
MHRSTFVNLKFVNETVPWFGNVVVKLNDEKETKLTVAHDRVAELKARFAFVIEARWIEQRWARSPDTANLCLKGVGHAKTRIQTLRPAVYWLL